MTSKPNIIFILSDDQPIGTFDAMPVVSSEIVNRGMNFTNAVAPTSLCAPSRSALLTGKYANETGCYTNDAKDGIGAWPALEPHEDTALPVQLKAAGYTTALVGKYMNKYADAPEGYVPPGWDHFITFVADKKGEGNGAYYNYLLTGTIYPKTYGDAEEDYSTDVLSDYATDIIASTPANEPLFLMFTPWGPHANYTPPPRYVGTWDVEETLPPSFNELDVSDKSAFIQALGFQDEATMREHIASVHEVLMATDDATAAILSELEHTGRLDNTMIIFMSDNGKAFGQHRWAKKDLPYLDTSEVPLAIRWDGHVIAGETGRITPNIDVTATISEAAGIVGWPISGRSTLSMGRAGTLMEQVEYNEHPAYVGWRTARYLFIEYSNDQGQELYDYQSDPYELQNVVDDPAYLDIKRDLRQKAKAAAVPVPPGFTWK